MPEKCSHAKRKTLGVKPFHASPVMCGRDGKINFKWKIRAGPGIQTVTGCKFSSGFSRI
jgi:hypothetical protein